MYTEEKKAQLRRFYTKMMLRHPPNSYLADFFLQAYIRPVLRSKNY